MSPENALIGPRRGRLRQVGRDLREGDGAAQLHPAAAVVSAEGQADVSEAEKACKIITCILCLPHYVEQNLKCIFVPKSVWGKSEFPQI